MLVLTRKNKEQIQIGDGITVTVLRVKGKSVRIGVDAPRDVRILRAELPPGNAETNSPRPTSQSDRNSSQTGDVLSNCESSEDQRTVRNNVRPERTSESVDTALPNQFATLHVLMARRKRRQRKMAIPR